jgi:hypothetical protein
MSEAQFILDFPQTWREFDLSGEALARARAEALAMTQNPGEKARINDMFRQGREISRSARKHGALVAMGTTVLFQEGLFMANGMVFSVSTPEGQELTLPVLSAQLGISSSTGSAPADRLITSVTLPNVGSAARVTGTETTPLRADIEVKVLTMHTMIPIPGTTQEFLVVTLASPNRPLKEEVYDLFDAITSTFRFVPVQSETAGVGPTAD